MKKLFTTWLLLVLAVAGFQAKAVSVIGDAPFGGWNRTGGVQMTLQDGIYSVTVNDVPSGKYFAIAPDESNNWDNVRRPSSNGAAPSGNWESTSTGGGNSWMTNVAGNYTFEYNPDNQQVRVTVADPVVAAPAWYLVGEVPGWSESDDYKFAENNGVFTLTKTMSGEFKLKDEKGHWYGNGKTFTAEDNSVELGENGSNNTLAQESEYTFTIENNVLTITGFPTTPVDPTMTLKGSFDNWGSGVAMTYNAEAGTFTVTQAMDANAQFKFDAGNNVWYGPVSNGNFEMAENYLGQELDLTTESGMNNFQFPVAGEWTFVVNPTTMKLVVTGTWPQPAKTYPVIFTAMQNGNVTAEPNAAAIGETVTLTVAPAANYQLKTLTVKAVQEITGGSGEPRAPQKDDVVQYNSIGTVATTKVDDTHYTFVIPATVNGGLFVGNQALPDDAKFQVSATFEAIPVTAMTLKGSFDNWSDGEAMTQGQDGKFTITKTLDANAEFKFVDNANRYYGPVSEGNFVMAENYLGQELDLTLESGMNNFIIPVAGEWTFTVDPANKKLVITGTWPTVEPELYLVGSFCNWDAADAVKMTYNAEDGTFSISETFNAKDEFKFIAQKSWDGTEYGAQSDGAFWINPSNRTASLLTSGGQNIHMQYAGIYTLVVDPANLTLTVTGQMPTETTLSDLIENEYVNQNMSVTEDLKVVEKNSNYAIVSDGKGNWLKVTGMDAEKDAVVWGLNGTYNGGANPTLTAAGYETSDAVVEVALKSYNFASQEAPKANEVLKITGNYQEDGTITQFSGKNGEVGESIAVNTAFCPITLEAQKTYTFTGVAQVAENAPAGAPAKVPAGFSGMTLDVTGADIPTGVTAVKAFAGKDVEAIYNLNGQRVNSVDKGIYILRHADGTTSKVRF